MHTITAHVGWWSMRASSLGLRIVAFLVVLCCLGTLINLKNITGKENRDRDALLVHPMNEESRKLKEEWVVDELPSLNDKTLPWNASRRRHWFRDSASIDKPPAVVTLTSMYWNHPNQTFGLTNFRTRRSRQLLEGVLNHPWFHPTAWDDVVAGRWPHNDTRIYAFFDYETVSAIAFATFYRCHYGNSISSIGYTCVQSVGSKIILFMEKGLAEMQIRKEIGAPIGRNSIRRIHFELWLTRRRFGGTLPSSRSSFLTVVETVPSIIASNGITIYFSKLV